MEQVLQEETNKGRPSLLSPFAKSKHFTFLFIGQLLSTLGSSITMVILPIIVLQLTQSTLAMGTVMTAYMLPHILILPLSGLFVDKLNRVKIMLWTDLIRFVVLIVLSVLVITEQLSIGWLYVLVAILGLMDGMFLPAYSAVRAKVFTPDIRNAANSITQVSKQGIMIIGPAIGGAIIVLFSAGIGLGIDGFTFLISFVCLLFLRDLRFKKDVNKEGKTSLKEDFIEGFAVLKTHPWLWITILAFSFINICMSGILRILVPWIVNVHHGFEPFAFGLVLSASGAGAICSALVYGMRHHWNKRGILAYGGIALSGVSLLLMPFVSLLPLLMLLMFLNGFGVMLFGLIWEISLQEMVPEEKFGRVVSLDMLGSFALLPLGYIMTGWLAEWIGGMAATVLLSILSLAIVAVVMLNKRVRQFN